MSFQIKLEGGDELIARLKKLEEMKRVKAVIKQEARFLAAKMRQYPQKVDAPNLAMRGNGEQAKRIRAGFFARLNKGLITVPYKRTTNLGKRWTIETQDEGRTAIIGNNTPYGKLVQGDEDQTKMHKWSGWITTKGAMNLYGTTVTANIRAAFEEEINNA